MRAGTYGSEHAPSYSEFQPQQNHHEVRSAGMLPEKPHANYLDWGSPGFQYPVTESKFRKTSKFSFIQIIIRAFWLQRANEARLETWSTTSR